MIGVLFGGTVASGGGEVGDILHVRDEKTSGTSAGASSAATWNTRTLNTVKVNQITGASLASNQVTLPAGTYLIYAHASAQQLDRHQLRLRNVTDGSTILAGTSEIANDGDTTGNKSQLMGRFTLAAEKDIELQHYTEKARATDGLGVASSSGEVEVYADVWIEVVD